MRKTALAGLFTIALISVSSPKAGAEAFGPLQIDNAKPGPEPVMVEEPKLAALFARPGPEAPVEAPPEPEPEPAPAPAPAPPEPIRHVVADNESLYKIAEIHQTDWQRIFNKNPHIENPDVITVGTELIIPFADEALADRPVPVPEPVSEPAAAPAARPKPSAASIVPRGSSAGNTYTPGYCTWYVKERRPDLPNNLGNAYTWVERARAQGIPTGSAPRVGAAGQRGNHVVYVESVNGDGTVTISEMNHKGVWVESTRTLPADYFTYIY